MLVVGRPDLRKFLGRVRKVEVAGVRIDLAQELASAGAARNVSVSMEAGERVAERLRLIRPRIAETRFLWIDDNPQGNVAEMRILKALGASIDLARSDEEAADRLNVAVYDIVVGHPPRREAGRRH